jgi:hypothetical protein
MSGRGAKPNMKIRTRGLVSAIAALAFAVAGCGGGSGSTTTEPGPTANVKAVCHQAAKRAERETTGQSQVQTFRVGLVARERVAVAAQSDPAIDPALADQMVQMDQDIRKLIGFAKAKVGKAAVLTRQERQAFGALGLQVQHEADRINRQLAAAGFNACATSLWPF